MDGRTSATDLLSWWFRPPSGEESSWNRYFGDSQGLSSRAIAVPGGTAVKTETAREGQELDVNLRAVVRAWVDWPEEDLSNEDAEAAIEAFYGFIHAFGRKDIPTAMQYVAEDYHVLEDDREVDCHDLSSRLEALLESLHGFEFDVSLTMAPEPLRHPYGIVIYAEIQIDARRPQDGVKRNIVERRLILLREQADSAWKISAFSKPRN
jgi:ketosteroid isomerase-like protein